MYVLAGAVALTCTLGFAGIGGVSRDLADRLASVGTLGLFVGTAIYSIALLMRYPMPPRTMRDAQSNRWHIVMFGLMALLFGVVFGLDRQSSTAALVGGSLDIAARSLPLAFMFVGTYFEHRFEFFDIFVLVLITFTPVYHGVRVLATRRNPEQLRTPFHTAISVATIAASASMVALGVIIRQPLFFFMSPIGFLIGVGNLQFARRPYASPMAWWYEHMESMMGGGIAFHTAFLVLGAARLLGYQLNGPAAVTFWLLPTIIGVPATAIWTRYYRRKFGEGVQEVQEVQEVQAVQGSGGSMGSGSSGPAALHP